MKHIFLFLFSLFFISPVFAKPIVYVTPYGAGNNSGSSWTNALPGVELSNRIAIADSGSQFWIAAGIYKPSTYDQTVSFAIPTGVQLYGGFQGDEVDLTNRITIPSSTTLSGDIGKIGYVYDNTYHVVTFLPNDSSSILDGFTIVDGNAFASSNGSGGGVYASGNVVIRSCIFTRNLAYYNGGAIYIDGDRNSKISIINCRFSHNNAPYGGAIYNNNSSPIINQCDFIENNNDLEKKTLETLELGGAIYNNGLLNRESSPTIINCRFLNNRAALGGAIYNDGRTGKSSPIIKNCLFNRNKAFFGGALMVDAYSGGISISSPVISNCTFVDNGTYETSGEGGAIYAGNFKAGVNSTSVSNCIFLGNGGSNTFNKINDPLNVEITIFLRYCSVETDVTNYIAEVGNLNTDPLFLDPRHSDYRLSLNSPAINAGDPNTTDLPAFDLAGQLRIQGGRVDMGAYEFFSCLVAPCIPILIRKSK